MRMGEAVKRLLARGFSLEEAVRASVHLEEVLAEAKELAKAQLAEEVSFGAAAQRALALGTLAPEEEEALEAVLAEAKERGEVLVKGKDGEVYGVDPFTLEVRLLAVSEGKRVEGGEVEGG